MCGLPRRGELGRGAEALHWDPRFATPDPALNRRARSLLRIPMRIRTLLTVFAGACLLASCSAPAPESPPPRAVLVQTLDAAAAAPTVQLYAGEVKARIEADVGFRVGGKLIERKADVGAEVSAGALLALLDPADARLAASAAQAALAAADADLALARTEYGRAQELAARKFVSSSVLDTRRTALQAAEARLRQARAQAETASNQAGYTRLRAPREHATTHHSADPSHPAKYSSEFPTHAEIRADAVFPAQLAEVLRHHRF